MSVFLIGSDIYGLVLFLSKKKKCRDYRPLFTVIIPAHNEEKTIIRCLSSVANNDYPQDKLEIIVADDGSTDSTVALVKKYKKDNAVSNLKIMHQKNGGKARVLNAAMKKYAKGELIMCLDADSYLWPDAIDKAAVYFRDERVMALAANVKIHDRPNLLNLIQKFEYLVCYQMKRAQSLFNIEYIIGGIGSTFRKSALEKVGYYDNDTMTEDIDITMKILRNGNKKNRVIYGADVVAVTESVLDLRGLIRQRYRWKYGRCQTFWKNKGMFFNSDGKFTKGLTFFYLPFAIFCDLAFFFEPLMVGYILFLAFYYYDPVAIFSAFTLISSYIILNIFAEDTLSIKDKAKLALIAPTMYFYFYVLSYVEYLALIKGAIDLKNIEKSLGSKICGWQHADRITKTA